MSELRFSGALAPSSRAQPIIVAVLAAGVAVASVGLTTYSPVFALVAAAAVLSASLLALGERLPHFFLVALGVLLLGYIFLGRGLAHVGIGPVYVSEMILGIGCLSIITTAHRLRLGPIEWLLLAYMALGAARTAPYLGQYEIDALRDAVLWGYGLIAFAVLLAMQQVRGLKAAVKHYGRFLPLILLWVPIAGVISTNYPDLVPPGPGSDVSLLVIKAGDMSVHVSAIAAFVLMGLYTPSGFRLPDFLLWPVWLASAAVSSLSRAGMLTVSFTLLLVFLLKPSTRLTNIVAVATVALTVSTLLGLSADIGKPRQISTDQFVRNVRSIFSDEDQSLVGTKDFRLAWWGEIVSYTVEGPYFWSGKGFGVNLADSDGFQLLADQSLRAPHNSHLSILARMGVPGLALWITFQLAFAYGLLRAWRRASRAGQMAWAGICGWLLVYWLAIMVNTTFDPYIEGPQGGIWFWAVVGLGLYVMRSPAEELDGPSSDQVRTPLGTSRG